ncbi:MXAN_6652 family MXYO-CTERM-anchored protein [Myxococcus sp. Y35]|uniref:MXAN_6652 family MXYO-CTERM-anchored protein n=1 Tax=Pseudomyxococcus flavus TaxID=3115648 RepID=UPI003CEB4A61
MRLSFRIAGVVAVSSLCASPAFATSTGVTGQTGKDGATCSTCHKGGELPTVEFEGPTSLAPGATGQYAFIIRGGPAKTGGVGIAVDSTEATLQAGEGTKKLGAELTHAQPRAFTNNELRFPFTLVAPATDVTLTLFGAGNSSNADFHTDGDRAVATKLSVTVGKGTPGVGPDDDGEGGGCAAAGSAPLWALVLAASPLALPRRRRRSPRRQAE